MEFIIDFKPEAPQISPHFTAEAKTVGGHCSVSSANPLRQGQDAVTTEHRTQFRHESGKDADAPGFDLHIQPGEVSRWRRAVAPERKALIRSASRSPRHPEEWRR